MEVPESLLIPASEMQPLHDCDLILKVSKGILGAITLKFLEVSQIYFLKKKKKKKNTTSRDAASEAIWT